MSFEPGFSGWGSMMENDGFEGEDDCGDLLSADGAADAAAGEAVVGGDGYVATCGNCGASFAAADLTFDDCCGGCGSDDISFEFVGELDLTYPSLGPGWSS